MKPNLVSTKLCPEWAEFASQTTVPPVLKQEYDFVKPGHLPTWMATLKYDKMAMNPPDGFEQIMQDALEVFEPLRDRVPIRNIAEVSYSPDRSNGRLLSKVFNSKTKQDFVSNHWSYIETFWEKAHLEDYPVLWTQSGKEEMLPLEKVLASNVRCFTISPTDYFFAMAALGSDFNEALCSGAIPMIKHGLVLSHGGFINLMKHMESISGRTGRMGKGDCTRWDSSLQKFLMYDGVLRVRYHCWNKKGMSRGEWKKRMTYLYRELVFAYMILSTGDVLLKILGNTSGSANTTDDNCICHIIQQCYQARRVTGKSLVQLVRERLYDIALYADDNIWSANEEYYPLIPYAARKNCYSDLGICLKETDELVTPDSTGQVFLGMTVIKKNGFIYPVFSRDRSHAAMEKQDRTHEPVALYSKVSAFMLLCVFDIEWFNVLQDYALFLRNKYTEVQSLPFFTKRECQNFWLNQEVGGTKRINKKLHCIMTIARLQKMLAEKKITQEEFERRRRQSLGMRPQTQRAKSGKAPRKEVVNIVALREHAAKRGAEPTKGINNSTGNKVSTSNPLNDYLRCLVDPQHFIARVPDAFDRPTAVFRSIGSFTLPILVDNVNRGRFSFALSPKFGDISEVSHYQAAIANPVAIADTDVSSWTEVDWDAGSNYVSADVQGRDPRTDINAPFLTSATPSYYQCTYVNELTSKILVSGVPANQTQSPMNLGPKPVITSPAHPGSNAGTSGGVIQLPHGEWVVSITLKCQVSSLPSPSWGAINAGITNKACVVASVWQPETSFTATGTTVNVTAFFSLVSRPGANQFAPVLDHRQTGTVLNPNSLPNATVSTCTVVITPSNFATGSPYLGAGVISEVRPVAMACLVTYMGTLLNNGGEIAISYVPHDLVENNYFQNNTGQCGQLQMVENLRNLNGTYDGPIKDGAYCFWAPYSSEDTDLLTPEKMNSHPYPTIVCSGVFSPDSTVNSFQPTLRVETFTVFEFVTPMTMFEVEHLPGSQATVDSALNALRSQQFTTANNKHLAKIKEILSKAARFYASNAHWINPAATSLMGLL